MSAFSNPVPRNSLPVLRSVGLFTLLVGYAMAVLDFFVVNVALPTIGRSLHAPTGVLELVVSAYGVAFSVLLVLGGRLGDAFGRKRLYMAGMAGFTASSLACGLAPSAWALVAARSVQGATAAMMTPQVLATIQALTNGEERTRAVSRYGATAAVSSAAGQILGGAVLALDVANSTWRGIFLINVPVGLIGLIASRHVVPASRADRPTGPDPLGTLLLAVSLICLLVPLSEGAALGWPVWSWALLGAAPVTGAGFAAWERRWESQGATPLVPKAVVSRPTMRYSLAVVLPFFAAFSGFMFVYALATQGGLGLGPLGAGLLFVPAAVAFGAGSIWSPSLLGRFGPKLVAVGTAGQCVMFTALALTMFATWPHPPALEAEVELVLLGFAQGCVVSPTFRLALSGVQGHEAGAGSGVLITTQQLAIALGATAIGTIYSRELTSLGGTDAVACSLGAMGLLAMVGAAMAQALVRQPGTTTRRAPVPLSA